MKTKLCIANFLNKPFFGVLFLVLFAVSGTGAVSSSSSSTRQARTLPSVYILSPDDHLEVSVLGHDDLKAAVTILPDGTFNYPVVGTVQAAGLSVAQLKQELIRGLSGEFNQPQVTVSVTLSKPRQISVLGAVKAPGLYDVRDGWHLLDALAASGDLTLTPELTQATLITEDGRKTISIDLSALLEHSDTTQNPPLLPGDVLLLQPRDASVSQVQVTGQVVKPGSYPVSTGGTSVLALLNEAGGAEAGAALTRTQILHAGVTTTINLHLLMNNLSDAAGAIRLVPGDVLLIPENTARVAVMGEVHTPGLYVIPDGGTLPITTALALAGGADGDGDKKSVTVVRRIDGQPKALTYDTDAMLRGVVKTGAQETDVALQPGDILYVPTRHKGHGGADAISAIAPLGWLLTLVR